MKVTYQSPRYAPELVKARYVSAWNGGSFAAWCECSEAAADGRSMVRYDLRQGFCEPSEVPADVWAQAMAIRHKWPSYVSWPIESGTAS